MTGNMDAVEEKTDHSVMIKGENGEEAGAGIAAAQKADSQEVSDLLSSHPDLVLPVVPAGYALQPQGKAAGDNLTFTWQNARGDLIIYQRSLLPSTGEQPSVPSSQAAPVINSGSGYITINGYSGPMLTYSWEAGGFLHELILTDTTMRAADQQTMLP